MKEFKIKFKGKKYILVGSKLEGAIATERAFKNCLPSYAHLIVNGEVLRYGKAIGRYEDIEFLED